MGCTTFYLHMKCFYKPLYDLPTCDFWVLLLLTEQGIDFTLSQMQLLMNSLFHKLMYVCTFSPSSFCSRQKSHAI